MTKVYVGLDVGSSSCHLIGLNMDGTVLVDRKIDTGEANLVSAFESIRGETHVHLEASELAAWIRRILRGRVVGITVSHAKTNAWIGKDPKKTDEVDAFKLADLLRMGRIHEVYYPKEEERAIFKQVVQHYEDVTESRCR